MPTTSKGLRYPDSTAGPNVPQDIQNLANDVDTRLPTAWVTVYTGADSYSQTATGSATTLSGCSGSVVVPTGRTLEVDLQIPRVNVPVSGGVYVRLSINGVLMRTVVVQTGSTTSLASPAYLNATTAGTGSSMTFLANVYGVAGGGTVQGSGDGVGNGGPLFRYRIT